MSHVPAPQRRSRPSYTIIRSSEHHHCLLQRRWGLLMPMLCKACTFLNVMAIHRKLAGLSSTHVLLMAIVYGNKPDYVLHVHAMPPLLDWKIPRQVSCEVFHREVWEMVVRQLLCKNQVYLVLTAKSTLLQIEHMYALLCCLHWCM